MTFRSLAFSNFRGSWHRYAAFFFSSVFSVAIFFLYADFVFHPGVVNGTIQGADKVRQGLVACNYIIVIFSFFFILYANTAFLKSRKKEFGLLSLFGMTKRQIYKLVIYENILLSLLAVGCGIAVGSLFAKLFFMAMSSLLEVDNPIPFRLVPKAIAITVGVFLLLFQLITWASLIGIGRSRIADLLKAGKKPKTPPVASRWLTVLAVLCLVGGYGLAWIGNVGTVILLILPILFLTIIGTYFLFTQASIGVFRMLQGATALYYRRLNLLTVSQMAFKMKDNARLLFMVSILSAVVLTAAGTFYSFNEGTRSQLYSYLPHAFGYAEPAEGHEVADPAVIKRILADDGYTLSYEAEVTGIPGKLQRNPNAMDTFIVSESDYNRLAGYLNRDGLRVPAGHAVLIYPFEGSGDMAQAGSVRRVEGPAGTFDVTMDRQVNGSVINTLYADAFGSMLVVDDARFREAKAGVAPSELMTYRGYSWKGWEDARDTVAKIKDLLPPDTEGSLFQSRVERYADARQLGSLTMFIGLFVSVLFFVASGSLLYFKLFTELQDDQAVYRSLSRIGVTRRELRSVISRQIALVFFIPFVVGSIHAAFAFKLLGSLLSKNVGLYGLTVVGIFFAAQLLYFLYARSAYMRKLKI